MLDGNHSQSLYHLTIARRKTIESRSTDGSPSLRNNRNASNVAPQDLGVLLPTLYSTRSGQ